MRRRRATNARSRSAAEAGPYTGIIDQILETDREQPRKQRHTAKRIFERLREEYGFDGGYSSVKEYVREQKLASQEMFVPLAHPPGDAQADFGEAVVVIAGVQRKAHFLVVDLSSSARLRFPGRSHAYQRGGGEQNHHLNQGGDFSSGLDRALRWALRWALASVSGRWVCWRRWRRGWLRRVLWGA
jgi:hypothetical protein